MSKYRHEYKYITDAREDALLSGIAAGIMERDTHAGSDGRYVIRSLYFDTIDDRCLFENVSGYDPRWKFRIRYYNNDTSYIVLERKSKNRGMTEKESCQLTQAEAEAIISGGAGTNISANDKTRHRLLIELTSLALIPKVIVTYEREPFIYPAGNVRVTFDRSISSSGSIDKFLTGDYPMRPVMAAGRQIMEVKWDEVMPGYIKDSLNVTGLTQTAYSKYYMSRRYHM